MNRGMFLAAVTFFCLVTGLAAQIPNRSEEIGLGMKLENAEQYLLVRQFSVNFLIDYWAEPKTGFRGEGRNNFAHLDIWIFRPNPKIWLTGKKFYLAEAQMDRRIIGNFWLGISAQYCSSYERGAHNNWSAGPEIKIVSFSSSDCLSVGYHWGSFRGEPIKTMVVSFKFDF